MTISLPTFRGWLFLAFVGITTSALGQGRVSNVRMRAANQQSIDIYYDLKNAQPSDSIYVRLQRRSGILVRPNAANVSGAIGQNQTDGRDKKVVWNLRENKLLLREEVRAVVLVKQLGAGAVETPKPEPPAAEDKPYESVATRRYNGPGWALLSALAPGIGNIFVQNPTPKVGFRPLVTVAAYGLLIYGAGQQGEATQAYDAYSRSPSETDGEAYYQQANSAHQRYYIATRAAGLIWLTDVTLTLLKGLRNQRTARKQPAISLNVNYQANTPVALFRYSF
ncbi:hypothetical protein J2I47_00505 [Fibrella sp. HMF5335]|uniref:DUF5683 domain-containing protein n=1 Tax=Fibrella rubiginis TaxID=2817060 RepID=A0A939G9Z9_9BACT|nr:hypothetical protein [Fibrella rubiginis]MBO0935014.1 hypothetical protein [Fibrella rubiginis]